MLYVNTDGSISLTRGDTARLSVTIRNSLLDDDYNMQPEDTLTLSVKKSVRNDELCFQKISHGVNTFRIDPADTKSLSFGKYVYDVQLTTTNNEVYTIIEPSKFVILEEVT